MWVQLDRSALHFLAHSTERIRVSSPTSPSVPVPHPLADSPPQNRTSASTSPATIHPSSPPPHHHSPPFSGHHHPSSLIFVIDSAASGLAMSLRPSEQPPLPKRSQTLDGFDEHDNDEGLFGEPTIRRTNPGSMDFFSTNRILDSNPDPFGLGTVANYTRHRDVRPPPTSKQVL